MPFMIGESIKRWLTPALAAVLLGAPRLALAEAPPGAAQAAEAAGEEHDAALSAARAEAQKLARAGRVDDAIALFEGLARRREEALGPMSPELAAALCELATFERQRGHHARAERSLRRALAIWESTLGPVHPHVATALNDLAALYQERWEYARAEPLLHRSLQIEERSLGAAHPSVAVSLNNLMLLYRMRGDYVRAEPLAERALEVLERSFGPSHPNVASALNNMALVLRDKGEPLRAQALLSRALGILESAHGPESPGVATALANMALVLRDRGEFGRAEPLLSRALGIRERAYGPSHPSVADALSALANLYIEKADYDRAEPLLERALSIWESAYGPSHPDAYATLVDLSSLYVAQGSLNAAVRMRARGAEIQDRDATIALAIGSEEYKRAYMATLQKDTDATVSLHMLSAPEDADAAELALTIIFRRKGRVLDAMTDSLSALRRHLGPEEQALLDRLAEVESQIAAHFSRGPGKMPLDQYRAAISDLDRQRQRLEDEMSQRSAVFRAEQRPVTVAQVRAALPEGSALVEIFEYRPFHVVGKRAATAGPEPRYAAYVMRAGEAGIASVDLGEAKAIDESVAELRKALSDPARAPRIAARALDARVMAPIRVLVGDARAIFTSPDGALNLVPLGALLDEEGRYLIERYSFTYLTSGRELLRFAARAEPRTGALVIAAPDFGATTAQPSTERAAETRGRRSADMAQVRFPALPRAEAEARDIAKELRDARVLLAEEATEAALKAARGPRILHIATHGFFLPAQKPSVGGLSSEDMGAGEAVSELRLENRLLRSGLAFAGANARHSGLDDGVLTALEASALDLHGTKLVVLSACETAVGEASLGEGVYGLRRALVMAGAETQVMSLWRVDDEETRRLMVAYYRRLGSGGGRSEALRDVELAMLAEPSTKHPYYWAGFIASGNAAALDGKPALPKVRPPAGCGCVVAPGEGAAQGGLGIAFALGLFYAAYARKHAWRGAC